MTAMPSGTTLFVPASSGGGGSLGLFPTVIRVGETVTIPEDMGAVHAWEIEMEEDTLVVLEGDESLLVGFGL